MYLQVHILWGCYHRISPGAFDVEATHKRPVLRVVVNLSWFHERADVCFGCHLVQWGPGASSGDLSIRSCRASSYPEKTKEPAFIPRKSITEYHNVANLQVLTFTSADYFRYFLSKLSPTQVAVVVKPFRKNVYSNNTALMSFASWRTQPHLHDRCEVSGGVKQPREPNTLRCHQILRPCTKLCDTPQHVHELAH